MSSAMSNRLTYAAAAVIFIMALACFWLAWRVYTYRPLQPPEPQPFVLGVEIGGMSLGVDDAQ